MLKIVVVCKVWPSSSRSGLSLTAGEHVRVLSDLGNEVSIIGSLPEVLNEDLPVSNRIEVSSHGSGAIYSPSRVDKVKLENSLISIKPDIVFLEGWQTSITHEAIRICSKHSIPVVMFSHGSSVHPFTTKFIDVIRSIAWWPYKTFILPSLVKKINLLMVLSLTSSSNRFYDREIAKKFKIPVLDYVNVPVNWTEDYVSRSKRKNQVMIIGYFSNIKNQLLSLQVAAEMSPKIKFLFVGLKCGSYYDRCVRFVEKMNLDNRVKFCDESEVNIRDEIASSMMVFAPSITEVLSLTLLESMACGTPFVATPVGATVDLKGGIITEGKENFIKAINDIFKNEKLWLELSDSGIKLYKSEFTIQNLRAKIQAAIASVAIVRG